MKTKSLLFTSLFVCSLFQFVMAQVNVGDSLALVDLYNSTGGPNWNNNKNWLTPEPLKTWRGIRISQERVSEITLNSNHLVGSLPQSIGNIGKLTALNLEDNQISGTLPSSMANLSSLSQLSLYDNQLSGTIPSFIGTFTQLTGLDLGRNHFAGALPSFFQQLPQLQYFGASANGLTGSLPTSLFSCKQLAQISLDSNQLSGQIPAELNNLKQLIFLYLNHNQFSGSLPDAFDSMVPLGGIFLSDNKLTGNLPPSMGRLPNLYFLYADHNQLSGALPGWLGSIRFLTMLSLSYNNFSGELPENLLNVSRGLAHPSGYILVDHNHLTLSRNTPIINHNFYSTANFSYNNFTFNGMETVQRRFRYSTYSPQASIMVHHNGSGLSVSAGGTLAYNTYQWFQVGQSRSQIIKGDSVFRPAENGLYYVQVTNAVATQLTLYSDTIAYQAAAADHTPISFYPNPVRNSLSLTDLPTNTNVRITLADMSGYVWLVTSSHQQSSLIINVSRLKAGHYLLSTNDGKELKTAQIVKQ